MLARLRIGRTRLTYGSMIARCEARCVGCQEPLTVAKGPMAYVLVSPYVVKNVLEEDCDICLIAFLRDIF